MICTAGQRVQYLANALVCYHLFLCPMSSPFRAYSYTPMYIYQHSQCKRHPIHTHIYIYIYLYSTIENQSQFLYYLYLSFVDYAIILVQPEFVKSLLYLFTVCWDISRHIAIIILFVQHTWQQQDIYKCETPFILIPSLRFCR